MLYNKKFLALGIAGLLLFSGCGKNDENKSVSDKADMDLVVETNEETTENSQGAIEDDEEDNELEKPAEEERITVEMGVVKGDILNSCAAPTLNRSGKDTNMEKYNVTQFDSNDELMTALADNKVNIAVTDPVTAANLYNSGKNIKILALNCLGNIYVASLTENVEEVSGDTSMLKDKTVYIAQDNSPVMYVIQKALENSGCKLEYVKTNDELVSMIEQGNGEYFAAPEPYLTMAKMKNSQLNLVSDLGETFVSTAGCSYVSSCIAVNGDFVKNNADALPYILNDHEKSINAVVHAPTRTAQWALDNKLTENASLILSTIQNCGFDSTSGGDMEDKLNGYFDMLNKLNKGFVVPDNDIYA